jgi:hypothetical protein
MVMVTSQNFKKIMLKIKAWLSHHPFLYALLGGTGVVLFWRGVWLTTDFLMLTKYALISYGSIESGGVLWWDGPLSLLLGIVILSCISAFVSSLIGNEMIISGLRAEKSLVDKESKIIKDEGVVIEDIRSSLAIITSRLDDLEHSLERTVATQTFKK